MKQLLFTFLFVLFGTLFVQAQKIVSGVVADESGMPLIGASVVAKEASAIGTITDIDGAFKLQVPENVTKLVVSYTGYKTQDIEIGGASFINITLNESAVLDEIVVVGYGAQAKRDVTGSISKVKGDDIATLISPSFVQQLAGRSAGVQIQNTSGILGSVPRINIRGVNSISSGTQPLVVIDGVPAITGDLGGFTSVNALSDLNSNDIESYEILKDGAATAIYGSRAANGVILITTKKGAVGKASFTYDGSYGVASAHKLYSLLGAQDFVTIQNEKYANAGSPAVADIEKRADGSIVDTDWQGLLFRNGAQQNHSLTVSGGADKTRYFVSFGLANMEGISIANSLKRYSFRANIEQSVNSWLTAGFNSGITRQENFGPLTGSNNLSGNIFGALRMLPNVDAFDATDPTGYNIDNANPRALGRGVNKDVISNGIPNQLFVSNHDVRKSTTTRLLGNGYLQARLLEGLTFRTQLGYDGSYIDDFIYQDARHGDGYGSTGYLAQYYTPINRWNWQNILSYNTSINDAHNLGLTLVQEYQKERSNYFGAIAQTISDIYFQDNIIAGTYATPNATGGIAENGLASYLGRLNYNYMNKYYLSGSIRRDELSSLAPGNRVGYFPGVSFAYRISEEGFWDNMKESVSDFRIRGSWAQTGNTNIGNYPYVGSFGAAKYGTQNGIAYSNFGNDKLKWETQTKLDFGFDIGFAHNKYNLSAAYWTQDNEDIILQAPTAPSLGVPNNFVNKNIGRVKGNGIELTFDAAVLNQGDFKWNSSINFSTLNNKVETLVNGQDIITNYNIIREGESIRSIYGYTYVGVNAANGNPIYESYNRDDNNNITETILVQGNIANGNYYVYDPANPNEFKTVRSLNALRDKKILGSVLPTYFGGFDNNFMYKGFDMNIFFRFSGGNKIMNRSRVELLSQAFNNNGTEILGRWQSPENPGDGQTPKIVLNGDNFINRPDDASTRWVEDGSFVKLQNVSLGYSFPADQMKKLKVNGLRVYVQGQNLLTFTKYKGVDPETSTNFSTSTGFGEDFNGNPQQRVISGGIKLTF
ncbi:MAG: TonB-dependent receptor [Saprospiraceae bacterium]|nr:TonB-dependent receptor [Saprospiraceae bacterium]